MNYYNEIKNKLIENENYARIKDYSKEKYKVQTYYEIGKLLYKAGKKYGENIINKFALNLQKEIGNKYNKRTLFRMKQFYTMFKNEKVSTLSTQLSWSHYIELLSVEDIGELNYYIKLIKANKLTIRELRNKIKNKEYERLDEITKLKLLNKEELTIQDSIKRPIIIHSKKIISKINEKDLQNIIIEIYMNYIDNNLKRINHDKTIGIIICKKDNHFIMEYCSDSRILSREYRLLKE